jgi:hypothetical protein
MSAPLEVTMEEADPDESPEESSWEAGETGAAKEKEQQDEDGDRMEDGGVQQSASASQNFSNETRPRNVRSAIMLKEVREAQAAQLRLKGKRALANHEFSIACDILTDGIALCPESYKVASALRCDCL